MLITLVNGSPRSRGATGILLQAAADYLRRQPGVEVFYLDLAENPGLGCRGCLVCYRTGRCAIQEDGWEQAADRLKASDGVILGSPTYGSNLTALLKNFLDRGHFIVEQALQGKYGMSISTYEIADGRQVNRLLNKFLLVAGAARAGSLCFKVPFNARPLAASRPRRKLEHALESFYRRIQQHRPKSWFEYLFTDWLLVRVVWKPRFLKERRKYAGILRQWQVKKMI